jgi:threonine dehydratase
MTASAGEITKEAITEAAARIAGRVRRTPVVALGSEPGELAADLVLKLEFLQPTGSFKVRGAFNLLLTSDLPSEGVVAASGGNFGLAIAYAAHALGIAAHVFVPDSSPKAKIDRLRRFGAEVHVEQGFYPEALAASQEFVARRGGLFAHAYDQREVVTGQGTCGRELEEQIPELDTIVVAVGGGGLIGGIASWYRDRVRIVAVETEGTPTLFAARESGRPVDVAVSGIAASALGAGRLGSIGWEAATRWVDEAVLVSDDAVRASQRRLWEQARLLVEPAAATTLAVLTTGAYTPQPDERVGLLLSGANVDPRSIPGSDIL